MWKSEGWIANTKARAIEACVGLLRPALVLGLVMIGSTATSTPASASGWGFSSIVKCENPLVAGESELSWNGYFALSSADVYSKLYAFYNNQWNFTSGSHFNGSGSNGDVVAYEDNGNSYVPGADPFDTTGTATATFFNGTQTSDSGAVPC